MRKPKSVRHLNICDKYRNLAEDAVDLFINAVSFAIFMGLVITACVLLNGG